MAAAVRRVGVDEWERVRELRLMALQDPDAGIAFLDTYAHSAAQSDGFWRGRTTAAATERTVAQFIAEDAADWIGTVTVIVRPAGAADHLGRAVETRRADVVGVYVRPAGRGDGTIDRLLEAAARWAADAGLDSLSLDVHVDNLRAQAAYRRAGFVRIGDELHGPIGAEITMVRALR